MADTCQRSARPRSHGILALQLAVTAGAVALAMLPPANGPMLVVPVTGSATAAFSGGGRLIGDGLLPGTLVVTGDRATLLPHLLRHGAVAIAASAVSCGEVA
ncbi:hypothetical protein ACFOMD_00730 [Sphingoaurantiacus capsulatus]|uniref:Uncharacterized protein n=1 Tax=Sphingoaurantiacus capsulatus TaxID=1771310 RepID=A0ABV7X798_9SPHN